MNHWKLLKEEEGQGLVEFAIVLPILLFLTLGTLMLTVSYLQKARLNSLAFSSARVAAVRRPGFDAAQWTIEDDQSRSKQRWLSEIQIKAQQNDGEFARVQLSKAGQRLDILVSLINPQPNSRPQDLNVQMQLPREYKLSGEPRPQTFSEVDYTTQNRSGLPWLDLLGALPDSILDSQQMADPMQGGLGQRDKILSLAPPNQRLQDFYRDRGWDKADYLSHTEVPKGQLRRVELMGENFKAIEAGGNLAQLVLNFVPLAGEIKQILGQVGAEAAASAEKTMSEIASRSDENLRSTFGGQP